MKKLVSKLIFSILALAVLPLLSSCFSRGNHRADSDADRYYKVNVRSTLNVREHPSATARVLGTVPDGTVVMIDAIEGEWARINLEGVDVYISANYLTPCDLYGNPRAEKEPVEDAAMEVAEPVSTPVVPAGDSSYNAFVAQADIRDNVVIFTPRQVNEIRDAIGRSGLDISVVTVAKVDNDKFFSFADDIHNQLGEERSARKKENFFVRTWHTIADNFYYEIVDRNPRYNKERYTMVYDASTGLLSVAGGGQAGKVIEAMRPQEKFKAQLAAVSDAFGGIMAMVSAYAEARKEYDSLGWYKKGQLSTVDVFDYLSDGFVVQNILPNDSFWHSYIVGPLCKFPFRFASALMSATSSFVCTMVLLALLWLAVKYGSMTAMRRVAASRPTLLRVYSLKWGSALVCFFIFLSLLSLLVFVLPDMEKVMAMKQGGYSQTTVDTAVSQFSTDQIVRSWPLIIFFIVGLVLSGLGNAELASLSYLGPRAQQQVYRSFSQSKNFQFVLSTWGFNGSTSDLAADTIPFTTIYNDHMPEPMGQKLGLGIPAALILNPGFMLLAGVYMWVLGMFFATNFFLFRRQYRSNGLLQMG